MESPNHYELLCVTPEATADEIRTAYRRLIRVYHPDVASDAGTAMTRRLNEAQRLLLSPALRADYDRQLHLRPAPERQPQQTSRPAPRQAQPAQQAQPAWNPLLLGGWAVTMMASLLTITIATVVVFVSCYAGPLTLSTPRIIPPLVIAVGWLVAGMPRTSKLLVVLLIAGSLLWPVSALGVPPFSLLATSLSPAVLPLVTLCALAVAVLRVSAPRFTLLMRIRPAHRPSQA
jgi:hypothetical protein